MATVAATGGSKEVRRRRIIERGADRLALITGRIQSLPPDPDTDQSRPPATPPTQIPSDAVKLENALSDSPPLPNLEEPSQRHTLVENKEPSQQNSTKGKNITSSPLALEKEETSEILQEQSQLSSSTQRTQVDQAEPRQRSPFTAAHISSAITASENIRMCCSVAAAILVILSYVKFPILGGDIIRNVVTFKPLYMLLLTNISIVLAWLILGIQLKTGRASSVPKFGGNDMVDRLGEVLEKGLLMQKILEAMFMDFGIYAVVLICGLSLL
ncbi:RNA-binding (RRM/RBD/RNP motifs) family protein [Striga asiatica]|uniref:RNA-binding (RRM/RBD/RNP motifs) family protein n=1 Tax=Striga asiatica TaxID=4170 RepID=A0A5A7PI28_STRAF|nr:RNA-binding (RRM/RBD/RNP motifs) family protein [Striga asiatica]